MVKHASFFDCLIKPKEGFAKLNLNAKRLYDLSTSVVGSNEIWKTLERATDLAFAYRDVFENKDIQIIHNVKTLSEGILSANFKPIALSGLGTNPLPVKLKTRDLNELPEVRVPKLAILKNLETFDDITPEYLASTEDAADTIKIPDLLIIPPCMTKIIGTEKLRKAEEIAFE